GKEEAGRSQLVFGAVNVMVPIDLGPAHVIAVPTQPGMAVVAQVGDEHAGGEVVKATAFGRPVVDAGAGGQDGLGWSEGAEGTWFNARGLIASGVGGRFEWMVQGVSHFGIVVCNHRSCNSLIVGTGPL